MNTLGKVSEETAKQIAEVAKRLGVSDKNVPKAVESLNILNTRLTDDEELAKQVAIEDMKKEI